MKTYFNFFFLCFSYAAIGQKHSLSINYKPSLTYFGKQNEHFNNFESILLPPADKRYRNIDWAIPIGIKYQKNFSLN
jgi:hypothetical protein